MARYRKKSKLSRLYADYFILQLVLWANLIHLALMLLLTLIHYSGYRYLNVHMNNVGGWPELLQFLGTFLLPSLLSLISVLIFNWVDRKKQFLRGIVKGILGIMIAAAMLYTIPLSLVFKTTMPLASYTTNPKNFGRYDTACQNNPTTLGPMNLAYSMPKEAENVSFSYWFIDTFNCQWEIHVHYTLPEGSYASLRQDAEAVFGRMEDVRETTENGVHTYDTGDYRQDMGQAWTIVGFSCNDETREVDYTLRCFIYN